MASEIPWRGKSQGNAIFQIYSEEQFQKFGVEGIKSYAMTGTGRPPHLSCSRRILSHNSSHTFKKE